MLLTESTQTTLAATAAATSGLAAVVGTIDIEFAQQWLGVPLPMVLAAFCGASFSLIYLEVMSARKSVVTVACSTFIAVVLTSIFIWSFSIPHRPAVGLAGLLGLFGQTIIGASLGLLPDALKKFLDALIDRVRGR